jgi:YD repeat-containing protein
MFKSHPWPRPVVAALAAAACLAPAAHAPAAPCPVALPVAGEYSSGFGPRGRGFHAGIDLRAPSGTPVWAASGGTVTFAGRYFAYGLLVEVEHADGSRARYAHLARIAPGVRPGAALPAGGPLGAVGRTGRTTGAHLHVELRRHGRAVDPWPWLTRTACDGSGFAVAAR